jgi:hypothetical protein
LSEEIASPIAAQRDHPDQKRRQDKLDHSSSDERWPRPIGAKKHRRRRDDKGDGGHRRLSPQDAAEIKRTGKRIIGTENLRRRPRGLTPWLAPRRQLRAAHQLLSTPERGA